MVLFDGIQKKLTHLHPRQDKRLLYYKVVDKKPIKIFISTPNLVSDFVILSSFVLKTERPLLFRFLSCWLNQPTE